MHDDITIMPSGCATLKFCRHALEFVMAIGQKIRIYDLAKELKLDNKKVIEDARREGVDVAVPSNSVPFEVAARIRTKYFPKKAAPPAGPPLLKHIKHPGAHDRGSQLPPGFRPH